ncbi:MAG: hydroxymethylbilane synthase [Rhodospirillales bacterium]
MTLKIGTRASPLALWQADHAQDQLIEAWGALAEPDRLAIVEITTTGDQVLDRPLAEVGGKGLFTRELDTALLDGRIDLAVHSMKDVPTWLPDGIVLAALLPRADVREVLISPKAASIEQLPEGAVLGTTSLRRQAQVMVRRPDLKTTLFRGNVQTRLRKLEAGEADATFLALAGLDRLCLTEVATAILEPDEMLPAVAQGAIGITCRAGDAPMIELLAAVDHAPTRTCVGAERAMLEVLDGSCRTPIAGLAELEGGGSTVRLRGFIGWPDGHDHWTGERMGPVAEAAALARDLGGELRDAAGSAFFAALADDCTL